MAALRLGYIEFINCLPVYHALEEGILGSTVGNKESFFELVKGPPTKLNRLLLEGQLDITPISSIEYAWHPDRCVILPNLSISADGRVSSILLFSKVPPEELDGHKIALTSTSATSVVLLKILCEHYFGIKPKYATAPPDLEAMLAEADGALLIGDAAMIAAEKVKQEGSPLYITDLGEAWKEMTGEKMVYAVWVIRRELAETAPALVEEAARLLFASKEEGWLHRPDLAAKAKQRTGLPGHIIEDYLDTIKHDFGPDYRRALKTYYDYAYKSGLLSERVALNIWGE